jgi:hypothetical protein
MGRDVTINTKDFNISKNLPTLFDRLDVSNIEEILKKWRIFWLHDDPHKLHLVDDDEIGDELLRRSGDTPER